MMMEGICLGLERQCRHESFLILDKIWIYEHFERNDRYQNDFFPTEWYHKTDIDSGDIIIRWK